jgi:hypothetical protein
MKSVKIYNNKNELISSPNLYEDPINFVNLMISTNYFGKPERWILADSESYEPSDILQTEERISENTGESSSWVLLRAEYTIEIQDITDQLNKEKRIIELKKLLSESDFRMTFDYYKRMNTQDQNYWNDIRESWRSELRMLVN